MNPVDKAPGMKEKFKAGYQSLFLDDRFSCLKRENYPFQMSRQVDKYTL